MKEHPIKLIPAAAALLWLLSIGGAYAESPTPARKDLDKVKENTRAFDGSAPGKGGSTIDTTVRPSTGTVPSTAVRPSTTTAPSTTLTKPPGTTTTNPNPRPSSIDRIYVPSPVVKPAPAPKTQPAAQTQEKPKAKPATGTVPTGN